MYTNFVGGGDLGMPVAASDERVIISRDEAVVVFSLPFYMNYYISHQRASPYKGASSLPSTPPARYVRSSWQDRGFTYGG